MESRMYWEDSPRVAVESIAMNSSGSGSGNNSLKRNSVSPGGSSPMSNALGGYRNLTVQIDTVPAPSTTAVLPVANTHSQKLSSKNPSLSSRLTHNNSSKSNSTSAASMPLMTSNESVSTTDLSESALQSHLLTIRQTGVPMGMRMRDIYMFIDEVCGGRSNLEDLSCADVKRMYIQPWCQLHRKAFVKHVQERNTESFASAEAIMIVCHGMQGEFLGFVDALAHYFDTEQDIVDEMMLWIDIFCLDYNLVSMIEDRQQAMQWTKPLKELFHRFGNTLVVWTSLEQTADIFCNPLCLYQLFVASNNEFLLSFTFDIREEQKFLQTLTRTPVLIQSLFDQPMDAFNFSSEGNDVPVFGLRLLMEEFASHDQAHRFRTVIRRSLLQWLHRVYTSIQSSPSGTGSPSSSSSILLSSSPARTPRFVRKLNVVLEEDDTQRSKSRTEKSQSSSSSSAPHRDHDEGSNLSDRSDSTSSLTSLGYHDDEIAGIEAHVNLTTGRFSGWRERVRSLRQRMEDLTVSLGQVREEHRKLSNSRRLALENQMLNGLEDLIDGSSRRSRRMRGGSDFSTEEDTNDSELDSLGGSPYTSYSRKGGRTSSSSSPTSLHRMLSKILSVALQLFNLYMTHNLPVEAEHVLERIYAFQSELYGETHTKTMQTLLKRGRLAIVLKKYNDARDQFELYLTLLECPNGAIIEEKELIYVLQTIGNFYYARGWLTRAVLVMERCLAMSASLNGELNAVTLHCASILSTVYLKLGNEERALQTAKRSLAIALGAYGDDSPNVTHYRDLVEKLLAQRDDCSRSSGASGSGKHSRSDSNPGSAASTPGTGGSASGSYLGHWAQLKILSRSLSMSKDSSQAATRSTFPMPLTAASRAVGIAELTDSSPPQLCRQLTASQSRSNGSISQSQRTCTVPPPGISNTNVSSFRSVTGSPSTYSRKTFPEPVAVVQQTPPQQEAVSLHEQSGVCVIC